MAVPGQPPIPALTQWLRDNRRGSMKLWELADKLTAAGYRNRDGEPVTETTLRGWEAPSGGVPQTAVPYLERIFQKRAPGWDGTSGDQAGVIAAIDRQTVVLSDLVLELRRIAAGQVDLSQLVAEAVAQGRGIPPLGGDPSETPAGQRSGEARRNHRASAGTK